MKHKITKQPYSYTCGDNCCYEYGTIWTLDGEEVYRGPQDDVAILCILTKLNFEAEIIGLDEEGDECWELL